MNRQNLIVIEGVDGSGKETQSKKLYQRLLNEGHKVRMISYPCYDKDSSLMVRRYLSGDFGQNANDISPYIASTFFAMDRYASYKDELEEFMNDGGLVIADRYTTANMVHQAGKIQDPVERKKFLDWLWSYEFELLGLPVPKCIIFLDLSPKENMKLMKKRNNKITGEKQKDIHENDPEHIEQSYKNAVELAKDYHWNRIQCMGEGGLKSIETIHKEIFDLIQREVMNV